MELVDIVDRRRDDGAVVGNEERGLVLESSFDEASNGDGCLGEAPLREGPPLRLAVADFMEAKRRPDSTVSTPCLRKSLIRTSPPPYLGVAVEFGLSGGVGSERGAKLVLNAVEFTTDGGVGDGANSATGATAVAEEVTTAEPPLLRWDGCGSDGAMRIASRRPAKEVSCSPTTLPVEARGLRKDRDMWPCTSAARSQRFTGDAEEAGAMGWSPGGR